MSYTIDVYRGEAKAQKNIISFGAYVALFPQLIAGSIVRYRDIAEQLTAVAAWTKKTLCDDFRGTTDTIDAYFKRENHAVDYNNGEYVADSVYEEKFLKGSDKYAVFFNSNQAATKVVGSGEGKLLIIKDSYANTFGQLAIDDYAETHLIEMRFFKGKVSDYIAENGITEVLVLYNIPNFCEDAGLSRCAY